MFKFEGTVSSSKSLTNRALIVHSYNSQIQLNFQTESEDVKVLQKSLGDLQKNINEFYCGDAGTAFRFLAVKLSRLAGKWTLSGSPRLLSRPHQELVGILSHFGVDVEILPHAWILYSNGWKENKPLTVSSHQSSQFASSVLLNSWDLPFDLIWNRTSEKVSEGYFQMTKKLMNFFGMNILESKSGFTVPAQQIPLAQSYDVESDVSSCFSLAACGVQNGEVRIKNFPFHSIQPDLLFLKLFEQMGVHWKKEENDLCVYKTNSLNSIAADLTDTPDLFPVLAVLCARSSGVSVLSGLGHLSVKESDRLQNTIHLLQRLGRKTELIGDLLRIHGENSPFLGQGTMDPDQDHRMAMAAQVANLFGARFQILNPHVVDKSYPQFWLHSGGLL